MARVKACSDKELENTDRTAVVIKVDETTKNIAIFKVAGKFFAIDRYCTHAGGDLLDARVEGKVVVCPVHEATFDLETGKLAPSEYLSPHLARVIKPTTVYPVVLQDGDLYVEID